jgi:hypothetical protein
MSFNLWWRNLQIKEQLSNQLIKKVKRNKKKLLRKQVYKPLYFFEFQTMNLFGTLHFVNGIYRLNFKYVKKRKNLKKYFKEEKSGFWIFGNVISSFQFNSIILFFSRNFFENKKCQIANLNKCWTCLLISFSYCKILDVIGLQIF